MEKQKLYLGIDICNDYSQVSFFDTKIMDVVSCQFQDDIYLPTALVHDYRTGEWLIGNDALQLAKQGQGAAVQGFFENIAMDPVIDVAGERIEKVELISIFINKVLEHLQMALVDIGHLTVTLPKVDLATADAFRMAVKQIGLNDQQCSIQSHILSFEYYTISQKRELWLHDVGLFEFSKKGLYYYHLNISNKYHPAAVTVSVQDLSSFVQVNAMEDAAPELDKQFLKAVQHATEKKTITSFYLVGDGFTEDSSGNSWMNLSIRHLCAMRRRVFVGQNLYARGACYYSMHAAKTNAPMVLATNAELTTKEVYIRTIHRRAPQKTVLVQAGTPWYCVNDGKYVIISQCQELIVHIRDVFSNLENQVVISLDGLPARPDKMTKIEIRTFFEDNNLCHITVKDCGFGEIHPPTDFKIEYVFDLTEQNGLEQKEKGILIEVEEPKTVRPLEMKMSGLRLFSLEELCWYIYANVYTIRMELFDEKMYYWMDAITGQHTLSSAIENYQTAGKSLKEIVRLLLNSVDYLNNSEIAFVYNKLAELEKQNPVEQAKLAADNYYRYGRYMIALKTYQHVLNLISQSESQEITRAFIMNTWHNMGMTYMKLHHLEAAVYCMKRVYGMQKSEENLRNYMMVLCMAQKQDVIVELTKREKISSVRIEDFMQQYQFCESQCHVSERAKNLEKNLDFKSSGSQEKEYQEFVQAYIAAEKKKYEVT